MQSRERRSYSHINEAASSSPQKTELPDLKIDDEFSCNICYESTSNTVVTQCGHLYCWKCLYAWLKSQDPINLESQCPVCKAGVSKDNVIPIYGRGKEQRDPRDNNEIPKRPEGKRPPQPSRSWFQNWFQDGNPAFGLNVAFFPGFFAFHVNFNTTDAQREEQGLPYQVQETLSKLFLMFGVLIVLVILFH